MSYSFKNSILAFVIKYFRFILGALIILLLVLSTYLILLPKYRQISGEGYLDYERKQQTLEAKKKELSELQELQEELSHVTTVEIERLKRILPSSKEIPDIFLQMESLARESGLNVSRVSITEAGARQSDSSNSSTTTKNKKTSTVQASGIQTINISLTVEGNTTYDSLKILLDNIEDNMRIVDLDSLSYEKSEEEGSFSLNLATYYLE